MQLKHRLSLISVLIFSIVFICTSTAIYLSFRHWMIQNIYNGMESKTLLAAVYYLEQDELPAIEHESIRDQLRKTISRQDIAIFNVEDEMVNGEMDNDPSITTAYLKNIRSNQNVKLTTDEYFYHGLFYSDNQGDFVIITRFSTTDSDAQLNTLLRILFFVCIAGIAIIFVVSRLLGKVAYKPITDMGFEIRKRNTSNFNEPLTLSSSYREMEDLIETYNSFIDRLSKTFHIQKNFIDYVSHELRTPITALLGSLEVANQKSRSEAETQQLLGQLKEYTLDLQSTLDNMMLLSGAKTKYEQHIFRLDEVLWEVIEDAIRYHNANIHIQIDVEESQLLKINGTPNLLHLALSNLVENAIKYSNNQTISIHLWAEEKQLILSIKDLGIGIPNKDMQRVTENFFRGSNTTDFQGKGIGLSMSKIIFDLHQIKMNIDSDDSGTIIYLKF